LQNFSFERGSVLKKTIFNLQNWWYNCIMSTVHDEEMIKKTPPKNAGIPLFVKAIIAGWSVLFVLIVFITIFVIIMETRNEERLELLELSMTDSFARQADYIQAENIVIREEMKGYAEGMEESIDEGLTRTTRTITQNTVRNINQTNEHIGQIEQIYGDLLAEQKKKTLENLYNEESLLERLRDAEELFKAGKYRQANELYVFVANEQPDNLDAHFYRYYTQFLVNKGDQSQYRQIRIGLMGLEKRGYTRTELQEVLEYISAEGR
jgi:hypothetical protein